MIFTSKETKHVVAKLSRVINHPHYRGWLKGYFTDYDYSLVKLEKKKDFAEHKVMNMSRDLDVTHLTSQNNSKSSCGDEKSEKQFFFATGTRQWARGRRTTDSTLSWETHPLRWGTVLEG